MQLLQLCTYTTPKCVRTDSLHQRIFARVHQNSRLEETFPFHHTHHHLREKGEYYMVSKTKLNRCDNRQEKKKIDSASRNRKSKEKNSIRTRLIALMNNGSGLQWIFLVLGIEEELPMPFSPMTILPYYFAFVVMAGTICWRPLGVLVILEGCFLLRTARLFRFNSALRSISAFSLVF